ncbi:MAG: hypothetical protein JW850_14450 [Thermoflexales bacterium]|nr:hypothetical protein [Thermoflexales bacterium]
MSTIQSRVLGAGVAFCFIFLSGFWLGRSEKPYHVLLLNVHKLIGLAVFVFFVVTIYQMNKTTALSALELAAGVVTGLFFIGTIISGGLVTIDKPWPAVVSTMHKLLPWLTALSTAVTSYLLLSK